MSSSPISVQTATIGAAASLSGIINPGMNKAARISMPAAWTAANLTFQVLSGDGVTYQNLFDNFGTEYSVTAAAGREILLPLVDFLSIASFKIRSGTAAVPVVQVAAATLIVTLVP